MYLWLCMACLAASALQASGECSASDKTAAATVYVNTSAVDTFTTPGYRVAYFSSMECTWLFDAGRTDGTLVFEVQELLMENSRNCAYDSIAFYQGSTSGSQVQKLCGRVVAGSTKSLITIDGQYAFLKMKTDRSRQYAGAKIKYFYGIERTNGSCQGSTASLTATLESDFITSPGFPVLLDSGVSCTWTITCDAGAILRLGVAFSDMEYDADCTQQNLIIYDGSSASDSALLESWCDSSDVYPSQTSVFYTSGNVAHVTLSSSAASGRGFRLTYVQNSTAITTTTSAPTTTTTTEPVQTCSADPTLLTANDTWKYFRTLEYPNYYPNGVVCKWLLEAEIGFAINLTFVDSFLQPSYESCLNGDYVNIYDGDSPSDPLLLTFCGNEVPEVRSTGRFLYVTFTSDSTVNYRGFNAKYMTELSEIPVCITTDIYANLTATTEYQNFTSPGYPDQYNNSMTVYWLIENLNQTQEVAVEVLDADIEISLNCIYDRLIVYNGPCQTYPVLGRTCGTDTQTVYSSGAFTLVAFKTDATTNGRGFNVRYYLTDVDEDDDLSTLIITGIVVGAVVGGLVVVGLAGFAGYKWYRHRTQHRRRPGSTSTSRSSSMSSLASLQRRPRYNITSGRTPTVSELLKIPKHVLYK